MDTINNIILSLPGMVLQFYNSIGFSIIKFIIGIYVIVVFVDILLLLVQRGLGGNVRQTILGINMPRELASPRKKKKLRIRWERIRSKLDTSKEADYKLAIIEADHLIDDLIKRLVFTGDNMTERLNAVPPGQLENIEDLRKAHEIRNRIIHEDDFHIDREAATETLALFEGFLKYFEVLD